MGLFSNKKPKLPSYEGVGLEALLQDPDWAYAISQAQLDIKNCEIVLRLDEAVVTDNWMPRHVRPAILFGQRGTLALAFPGEREINVQTRNKSTANLQTPRSGKFQIRFGHADPPDIFAFWGDGDNLNTESPEGRTFGAAMSAFLRSDLMPRQFYGTPRSIAAHATESLRSPTGRVEEAVQISPQLMHEADRFMEDWTHIVGRAPDEVFWPALSRFGRIGGALQGTELLAIEGAESLRDVLDRPWRTWLEIGRNALEGGDYKLTTRVFFFAFVIVEQVGFDADITAKCGFVEPKSETYRAIASQALRAADLAPEGWTVVERSSSPPTTKAQLQSGLRSLLAR